METKLRLPSRSRPRINYDGQVRVTLKLPNDGQAFVWVKGLTFQESSSVHVPHRVGFHAADGSYIGSAPITAVEVHSI